MLVLLNDFVRYWNLFDVLVEYVVEEDHVLFLMLLILFRFLIESHRQFDLVEIFLMYVLLFEHLIQIELWLIQL